jgi:hypothetical protein
VVHRGGLRGADRIEAADLLERRELLLDRVRNAVVGQQLADCAGLPLRRWTIVAPEVDVLRNMPEMYVAIDADDQAESSGPRIVTV